MPVSDTCCRKLTAVLHCVWTGFNTVCAARIFHKLMKRLGYKKFYAQGGDWGSLITTNMAQLEPGYEVAAGTHLRGSQTRSCSAQFF